MRLIDENGKPSETVGVGPFFKGMNNRLRDNEMAPDMLRDAVNVVIGDTGKVSRRQGFSLAVAGTSAHSGFGCEWGVLFVDGAALKLYDPASGVTSNLVTGLSAGAEMAYVEVNREVYYSNGVVSGKVSNGANTYWGIRNPGGLTLSTMTGGLTHGRYQFLATFEALNGEESGAGLAFGIDVTAGQGVLIAADFTSAPTGAASVNLYGTYPDGDIFYLVANVPVGAVSFQFLTESYVGTQLGTQFLSTLPAGDVLAYQNARVFSALGRVVTYTEPLAYGLYRPTSNYLWFPHDVQIMAGVSDGIWVVTTNNTYFLSGSHPSEYSLVPKLPFGGAHGSLSKMIETDDTWCWYSDRGVVFAGPGGVLKLAQEENLTVDAASSGATIMLEQNGYKQVVSQSARKGYITSAAASGYVDMEVRRAGSF